MNGLGHPLREEAVERAAIVRPSSPMLSCESKNRGLRRMDWINGAMKKERLIINEGYQSFFIALP